MYTLPALGERRGVHHEEESVHGHHAWPSSRAMPARLRFFGAYFGSALFLSGAAERTGSILVIFIFSNLDLELTVSRGGQTLRAVVVDLGPLQKTGITASALDTKKQLQPCVCAAYDTWVGLHGGGGVPCDRCARESAFSPLSFTGASARLVVSCNYNCILQENILRASPPPLQNVLCTTAVPSRSNTGSPDFNARQGRDGVLHCFDFGTRTFVPPWGRWSRVVLNPLALGAA